MSEEELTEEAELIKYLINGLSALQLKDGSILGDELLTHHFTIAMMNCGFSPVCPQLQKVKKFFLNMSEYPYEINPFKLATLLELKEESDEVKERIEYLISKKQKKDGRFEFPARYLRAGDLFSTMFGVRILLSYSQYKHYRPNIEKALQYVVEHRGDFNTLRDMGFAVYILARYDFKKYAPIIQELTEQIISKQVNGKWEGSLEDNCWLVIDLLAVRGRFDDKSLNEKIDIVVEKGIRYIKQVSKQFLKIFYDFLRQLNLTHKPSLVEQAQFFVLHAARIISVLCKYRGEVLTKVIPGRFLSETTINLLADLDKLRERSLEIFVKAFTESLNIEIEKLEQMKGGFSGAQLFRVQASITIPGYGSRRSLPSVIMKISREEVLDIERENFRKIPTVLQPHFAQIPEPAHYITVGRGPAVFLVMQDLVGYHTLEEIVSNLNEQDLEIVLQSLTKFLSHIYTSTISKNSQGGIVRNEYINKIIRDLSEITPIPYTHINGKQQNALDLALKILKKCNKIEPTYTTLMHGDLNLRNIMVSSSNEHWQFKLIDIDKLNLNGDFLFDIGELLVDARTSLVKNEKKILSDKFITKIEEYTKEWVENDPRLKEDLDKFDGRLSLAKARSYVKLARITFISEPEKSTMLLESALSELEGCLSFLK